jgi:hypothetical protein
MNTAFLVSYIALWFVFVGLVIAVLALYNYFGEMYLSGRESRESQGPAVGADLPHHEVETLDGRRITIPSREKSMLILYASTACPECDRLRQPLARLAGANTNDLDVIVACAGRPNQVAKWAQGLREPLHVVADPNFRLAAKQGIGITPFVVGVDPQGKVKVKGLLNGEEGLRMALDELFADDDQPAMAATGGPPYGSHRRAIMPIDVA